MCTGLDLQKGCRHCEKCGDGCECLVILNSSVFVEVLALLISMLHDVAEFLSSTTFTLLLSVCATVVFKSSCVPRRLSHRCVVVSVRQKCL